MTENMMTPEHKATNDNYRKNYDRIFGERPLKEDDDDTIDREYSYYGGIPTGCADCVGDCSSCIDGGN